MSGLIGALACGVVIVDERLRIVAVNGAARSMLDPVEGIEGRPLTALTRDPEVLGLAERVAARESEVETLTLRLPDRGRQFEVQIGRADEQIVLQFDDVTRLERLEAVRREFVANVSHELRTPLTSIRAAIETLDDTRLDAGQVARFHDVIRRQTTRMGELIEDLTDLSKIETGAIRLEIAEIELAPIVGDTVGQLEPLAARLQVAVEQRIPAGFRLAADRRRLEQMLTNLLHNAIKFNRPGGRVAIEAHADSGRRAVAVVDDGIGIASDSCPRIFNRFYQVDQARSREVGGTGLGLAIVKHLMRLHGGQVRVESALGTGSRFTLEFPHEPT